MALPRHRAVLVSQFLFEVLLAVADRRGGVAPDGARSIKNLDILGDLAVLAGRFPGTSGGGCGEGWELQFCVLHTVKNGVVHRSSHVGKIRNKQNPLPRQARHRYFRTREGQPQHAHKIARWGDFYYCVYLFECRGELPHFEEKSAAAGEQFRRHARVRVNIFTVFVYLRLRLGRRVYRLGAGFHRAQRHVRDGLCSVVHRAIFPVFQYILLRELRAGAGVAARLCSLRFGWRNFGEREPSWWGRRWGRGRFVRPPRAAEPGVIESRERCGP